MLTPELAAKIQPRPLHVIAGALGQERATAAWAQLEKLGSAQRVSWLRKKWQALLGTIVPAGKPRLVSISQSNEPGTTLRSERVLLETESDVVLPLLILSDRRSKKPKPVVIALAQQGKAGFLKHRADLIAQLLKGDVAICLPDVRGAGETHLALTRGRTSEDTSVSSSELMLGETVLGARLRDLRGVVHYLRTRRDLDARRLAVWGDSFTLPNASERDLKLPYGIREEATTSEPLGSLLALLLGLYEEDVRGIYARGGLVGFQSVLSSAFLYVPHDVVIPDVLTAGDLSALAAGVAPRPLALVGLVDGLNRVVEPNAVEAAYAHTRQAYEVAKAHDRFVVGGVEAAPAPGLWLLETLNGK